LWLIRRIFDNTPNDQTTDSDELADLVNRQMALTNSVRQRIKDGHLPTSLYNTNLDSFKRRISPIEQAIKANSESDTPQEYTLQDIDQETKEEALPYSSFYLPHSDEFVLLDASAQSYNQQELDVSRDSKFDVMNTEPNGNKKSPVQRRMSNGSMKSVTSSASATYGSSHSPNKKSTSAKSQEK
jgi:hypothetical protein